MNRASGFPSGAVLDHGLGFTSVWPIVAEAAPPRGDQ